MRMSWKQRWYSDNIHGSFADLSDAERKKDIHDVIWDDIGCLPFRVTRVKHRGNGIWAITVSGAPGIVNKIRANVE